MVTVDVLLLCSQPKAGSFIVLLVSRVILRGHCAGEEASLPLLTKKGKVPIPVLSHS